MFSPKMAFKGKECVCRRECDCVSGSAEGGTAVMGRIAVNMSPQDAVEVHVRIVVKQAPNRTTGDRE